VTHWGEARRCDGGTVLLLWISVTQVPFHGLDSRLGDWRSHPLGHQPVLIAFGALLGKTTPLQNLILLLCLLVFYAVNESIGVIVFEAVDMGGSMFVHAFGAYFGMAASFATGYAPARAEKAKASEKATYFSDLTVSANIAESETLHRLFPLDPGTPQFEIPRGYEEYTQVFFGPLISKVDDFYGYAYLGYSFAKAEGVLMVSGTEGWSFLTTRRPVINSLVEDSSINSIPSETDREDKSSALPASP